MAHLAKRGANKIIPKMAIMLPMNELMAESESAIPALPCLASG